MWSWSTLFFYLGMSLVGCGLIKKYQEKKLIRYYVIFFSVWMIWALGRYIGMYNGILVGGSDAPTYVSYFDVCLTPGNNHLYSTHTEPLFRLITKIIRYFTGNYRVYFFIIYGIIITAFLWFIKEFEIDNASIIPLIMLGFEYVKSFSIIRSMLSIAFILIGIICLKHKKVVLCALLMVISVFIQRASIIYAAFPVFYAVYERRKFNKRRAIRFVIISSVLGEIFQLVLAGGSWNFFKGGAYDKYIVASNAAGYWVDYFKIIIDQVFVLALIVFFLKQIDTWMITKNESLQLRYRYLKSMCYYDILLIPVCAILNIWRGVDFFYLPRLLLFGTLITTIRQRIANNSKRLYDFAIAMAMIAWFILRMVTMYDKSDVMPYIFDWAIFR